MPSRTAAQLPTQWMTRYSYLPITGTLLFFSAAGWMGCKTNVDGKTLFTEVLPEQSGIAFENRITENAVFNITTYEYLYNGGGVAAGDLNNDGLTDLYFTGNMVPNRLYLNKGLFSFTDVTDQAGVAGRSRWKTGVNLADINADGLLDIYLCYSGPGSDTDRANELYINQGIRNGVPVFKESAKAWGLDAPGSFTTQCAFFDMDRDGDLDAFMVNHADMFYNVFYNTARLRSLRHPQYGNRLYRNDGNHFTEISDVAGISGSGINFGLGVAIDDVNGDHWPDIYVTNDYNEQDFLYLNLQNGSFREVLQQSMGHISQFSMGADMSDLNNDGLTDIISLDMMPEDNYRQKLLKGPEGYDYYQLMADSGYHHQQMRNMLQLNMGVSDQGVPRFSEIGQLAGISQTDWSWSPLVADLDNDGHKDLYVTNGYLRDFTNMDFLKFTFAEAQAAAKARGDTLFAWELIRNLPGTKLPNYAFQNRGGLQFSGKAAEWGLSRPSISTGAAWADLDNDGDLDLAVNNSNEPAMLFQNNSNLRPDAHYLQLRLSDSSNNRNGIGATARLWCKGQMQQQTLFPARGFQSASQPVLHFGLSSHKQADSLRIWWPDGSQGFWKQLPADTLLVISKIPVPVMPEPVLAAPWFTTPSNASGIAFHYPSDGFVDFKRSFLMPYQVSRHGPAIAKSDVNGDGLEDIFLGGNDSYPARLFLQLPNGNFTPAPRQPWEQSRVPDGAACFLDADSDGDADLYVSRHGMQMNEGDVAYQHRFYQNDGNGGFNLLADALPDMRVSSTAVESADYNRDGKPDLLVGGRTVPGRYPVVPVTYLLRNTGTGGRVRFEYAREQTSAVLRQPGMVTAAAWTDVNADGWPDLLMAGECMPITLLINRNGQLTDAMEGSGFKASNGWWCRLATGDLDGDGDQDLVAGNAGLNLPMRASPEQPVTLFYNDFDRNGIIDPFLTYYIGGLQAPAVGLDDAAEQVPVLRKKFLRYETYARASWTDLFDENAAAGTLSHHAYTLESCWYENDGKGHFTRRSLPLEAQFSMMTGIQITDVDADGKMDIIAAGNFYPWRTQWGPMDASSGWWLRNTGSGFMAMYPAASGLWLGGDIRQLLMLSTSGGRLLVAGAYDGPVKTALIRQEHKTR